MMEPGRRGPLAYSIIVPFNSSSLSRRAFLARAAALAAASTVIAGCRRRGTPAANSTTATPPPAPLHNLDDVGSLATFRPPLPPAEPAIRVRVLRVREAARTPWLIGSPGQWMMANSDSDSERGGRGQAMQGPVEFDMTSRGWSIVDGQGFRAAIGEHDTIEFQLLADEPDGLISLGNGGQDSRQYRGVIRLVSRHDLDEIDSKTGAIMRPSHAFDAINDVPLETYLPGVLAGELYAHWKPETFAAQAVAARSFACTEAAIFAGRRHYDVSNTAASQMYLGAVQHDRAHEAVALTRGKMLAFDGLLVSGYYSSCCGGIAASATDAIGSNPVNNVPALHGREGSDVCTSAPVYQWTVQQPLEDLIRRLAGYGRERGLRELEDLRQLLSIETSATNPNGRPTRLALMDQSQQRFEMAAEDFRRAANFSSADGTIKPPDKELRSSNIRASIVGPTVSFEGYGFGHGVGLCQHGAEALARSGTLHEDILRWYYPGIEIAKSYA